VQLLILRTLLGKDIMSYQHSPTITYLPLSKHSCNFTAEDLEALEIGLAATSGVPAGNITITNITCVANPSRRLTASDPSRRLQETLYRATADYTG
jgi:hypothetical protein